MLTRKLKRILMGVIVALLAVLVVVALVKIGKMEKTKELGVTSYTIGTISETDGKDAKSTNALRSDYQKAAKFNKIELAENADVTYQIFYYNADKKFIGKSAELTSETTELSKTFTVDSATENVRYYRVVIKVPSDKDDVTLLNKGEYVKQLTVTVNK